ncbi:MAG TPA: 4-hydroxybenzoate octaprenyltransferase [Gemmatimonadales bacterium]
MTAGVDGQVVRGTSRLAAWSNFVKVAHTVFALPFTIVGITAAARHYPVHWRTVGLAVLAFATARFAAMGFNRIVDVKFDSKNPRTAGRELPAGRMSLGEAWVLVLLMAGLFVVLSSLLNPLCFWLSPVALVWVCGYSFSKRFTHLSHLWLGLGLAIAPVGGYLAISGEWSIPWWLLLAIAGAVACWATGFDVIYALQDEDFDREQGLKSIPVLLGAPRAIAVARGLHLLAVGLLLAFWRASGFGWVFGAGVAAAALLLAWEHRLVRVGDYSKLDTAFFTMNGIISGVVALGALVDGAIHA